MASPRRRRERLARFAAAKKAPAPKAEKVIEAEVKPVAPKAAKRKAKKSDEK